MRGEKQDDQRPERAKYSFRDLDTYILKTKKLRWTLEPGYEIKDGLSYVCNGFEVIKYMKISGNFVRVYNVLTQTRTEQSLVFRLSSTHHA